MEITRQEDINLQENQKHAVQEVVVNTTLEAQEEVLLQVLEVVLQEATLHQDHQEALLLKEAIHLLDLEVAHLAILQAEAHLQAQEVLALVLAEAEDVKKHVA